jgi:hypothetical protein
VLIAAVQFLPPPIIVVGDFSIAPARFCQEGHASPCRDIDRSDPNSLLGRPQPDPSYESATVHCVSGELWPIEVSD